MKTSIRKGLGFGLTSGIIATLGMMIGLNQGTHSTTVVLAGIGVIAVTDALSDAVAVFMADETELKPEVSIWQESLSTFFSKFLIGVSFALPVIFMDLSDAVIFSIIYGLILITILSYFVAKSEKRPVVKIVLGHLAATVVVVIVSALVGGWVEGVKTNQII
ncbi:MAG: hypothetical protein WCG99_04975 [Candidatus Berkelbacteria bacterium]